jgi:hypothetical protein
MLTHDLPLWRVTVRHPDQTPPYGTEYVEVRMPSEPDAVALVRRMRPLCDVVAVARRWA